MNKPYSPLLEAHLSHFVSYSFWEMQISQPFDLKTVVEDIYEWIQIGGIRAEQLYVVISHASVRSQDKLKIEKFCCQAEIRRPDILITEPMRRPPDHGNPLEFFVLF